MSHEPKNASYPAKEVRISHVSEGVSERGLHTTETVADGSIVHNTENSVLPDSPPPLTEPQIKMLRAVLVPHGAFEMIRLIIAAETDRARAEGARAELEWLMANNQYGWGQTLAIDTKDIKARLAALDKQEKPSDEL